MDQQPAQGKKSGGMLVLIIVVVLMFAGVGVWYFMSKNEQTNTNAVSNTNAATNRANTASDPYAAFMQYDNKVVTIASSNGKVTGKMAIAIRKTEEMPIQVVYFLKVKDTLEKKATSFGGASYDYIANHAAAADVRKGDGTGVLSPAFCNTDQMPDVLAMARSGSADVTTYAGCSAQYEVGATTDTFYHVYSVYYNAYTFSYDELVALDTFAVFDGSPYYESSTGGSYRLNAERTVQEGMITKSYALTYTE